MRSAGIIGTGLIGASIGRSLRAAGWFVTGWDPDPEALQTAEDLGSFDRVCREMDEVVDSAGDVLVLAAPPEAVARLAATIVTEGLVVDVAGVKGPIVRAAATPRFVGTHPMAGREHSGAAASSPALFRGAAWVVVTDGATEDDLALVEELVAATGARPIRMTAEEHDEAVSMISHLPQVLAAVLVTEAADRTNAMELAAGSFRDLTRVAASDPSVWTQLLLANRDAVIAAAADLRGRLERLGDALERGDADAVRSLLERARQVRRALAPPVVAVRVALADQPGELARVGRALERSGVDVRDLQLRHAPYGGGGVLRLSVRHEEAATLHDALAAEGLLLAD
jgi:prephenate dehydrogenase